MTINKSIILNCLAIVLFVIITSFRDDTHGLNIGDKAPQIEAFDQFNELFVLHEELEKGPVVLMFYRGHWCKYCNRQLEELSDSLDQILNKGASIIAVTPEKAEFVDETSKQFNDSFRIISDIEMKIMDAYGVSFKVKNSTITKYKIAGINLNNYNGENGENLPVPATYIIGKDEIIKYVFFNENYKKRVSIMTILNHL